MQQPKLVITLLINFIIFTIVFYSFDLYSDKVLLSLEEITPYIISTGIGVFLSWFYIKKFQMLNFIVYLLGAFFVGTILTFMMISSGFGDLLFINEVYLNLSFLCSCLIMHKFKSKLS